MFGDIAQDHVRAYWGHLIEPRLAELAFDIIFRRKAEAAMCLRSLAVGGGNGLEPRPGAGTERADLLVEDAATVLGIETQSSFTIFGAFARGKCGRH